MPRLEHLQGIVARLRKYAGFWSWPDKKRRELGVVEDLIEAMHLRGVNQYDSPHSAPVDPPDCTMRAADGSLVGVEVTELVCEEAARRNQKGERVYRDWRPHEVMQEIRNRLLEKDRKVYQGGPYSKVVVIIHTDEPVIAYEEYRGLLACETFGTCSQIQEAYFLISYQPDRNYCPYVELQLAAVPQHD